ncbi:hypothetical protein CK203_022823 [Vitis vinifera]|uniref:Uncharacterized protein n=1 Tax=Vitis vinifera TaxID=29760 RepID=A0A438IWL0_VITVI|nr:hypothetical protein CK203_069777 [Vitis vinifera]RVX01016.1 hypothetical protein CK203_022823 [Vitis vinifera]
MEAYKKWVRRNRDYVHSLESLANLSHTIVVNCYVDAVIFLFELWLCGISLFLFIFFMVAQRWICCLLDYWTVFFMRLHSAYCFLSSMVIERW